MRQKKRIGAVVWLLVVVCVLTGWGRMNVRAAEDETRWQAYGWVWNGAGLMGEKEAQALDATCEEVYQTYGTRVMVIATEDFGGGDIKEWQRKIYAERNGSEEVSGIMLAVSMAERDWGIVGFGDAVPSFTTYGREQMGGAVKEKLSEGDYEGAFETFVQLSGEFLEEAAVNEPYSEANPYEQSVSIVLIVAVAFVISLLLSLFIVLHWKKAMNTRIRQDSAGAYLQQDSFQLQTSSDVFLYHTMTRTKREKESGGQMRSDGSGTSGKF